MKYEYCCFLSFSFVTNPTIPSAFFSLTSGGKNNLEMLFFQQSKFWSDA